MKKLLFILVFSLAVIGANAQVINITGIGVTGRFNSCSGSNIPAISASLISTSGGASVSGGLFTCINPCDSSTIRVTISNAKWNKSPNNEWLHGLFLPASAGFSVSPVTIPPGFITYNTGCVGTCPSGSGINGGPGFYFDNSNGNSCCGTVTANDGFPCNNYGDATMACNAALSMTFDLTFCNSIITTSSHQFIVTGSSDGETGCWNFNDGLPHKITFTIPTVPCTPSNINPSATLPVRTCIGNTVNYTSILTGTCNASSVYWWDAATGGNLVGTGSPFVYDPAGAACPAGTTLYATCCSGANTTCVPRVPVTIPGVCNPLSISAANATNTICGVLGAINSVTVANAQGAVSYILDPGGIINSSGVFTGLNQNAYTVTAGDASGCTASTVINILQPAPITFSLPLLTNTTCIDPTAGQIVLTASGGVGVLTYSINPVSTQALPGIFTGLTAQSYTITATDITNCTATTIVTLATPTQPTWNTISGVDITCNGANDGSIQALATGGTALLSYTIQPSGLTNTTGIFNGLNGAMYTIQVSDANGCSTTTTINIVDPPVLTWSNVIVNPTSCSYLNDGAVNAMATGGTSSIQYLLLPSGSLNSSGVFTGLSAGNYTVQATDANNCSITTLITIVAAPPIVFANPVITSPLCHGGVDGQLSMTASGGTGSLTYSLNPTGASNTSGIFSTLSAGNYTVTATDNNTCSNTTTVTITEPTALQFSSSSLTSPLCNGGINGSINVLATGGTGSINYTLQPSGSANNTGSFTALPSGTYTISATDANGCSVSTILLMTQPPALNWTSATGNTVSCNGGNNGSISSSVVGGTGSISYALQPGGLTNSSGNFSSLLANTYTIQASDANGCTTSTIILITQPTPLLWTSNSHTDVQCNGASDATISISASGGSGIITYTLLPVGASNTNGAYTGLSAASYTIQASDANGCSITTSISISQPSPLLINNITNTVPSCVPGNDATIIINASGGTLAYSYSIGGPSQAGNIFSNIGAGNYIITVTDAHNCTVTSVQAVITPNGPVINASNSNPVSCFGGNNGSIQVSSNGGTGTINYTLQPGNITNTNGNFVSLTASSYTITVTDMLGCAVSTSVLVSQPIALNFISVVSNNVSCNGGNNGSIASSVVGGSGSISYTLQPGGLTNSTGNFSSLLANNYTITATDINGCTTSTIILITQPTPLLWTSTSNTNVSCNGGSDATISATASGGTGIISYTLLPVGVSNINGVFTGLAANNFTVQASDANGCSITTNVNISQPSPLLINNISNTIPSCVPGNDASITINANGGTVAYSYSIGGPSQAGNSFSNIGAGNYTITITDAHNCTVTSMQSVITPNGPIINASNSNPVSCFGGNNGSIQVSSSGGTGTISYTLQPGNINNTSGQFVSLTAASYTITAMDILGCAVSTSLLVTQPTALNWNPVVSNNVNCNGGNNGSIASSVVGGTGSISYTLQPSGLTNSIGNFSSLLANTYTIQASDANGCTTSTIILITQPTSLLWTSVSHTDVQCNGASDATISISASGGTGIISYTLPPTGLTNTNGVFTGLTANSYTIQASDANGCSITTNINISQPAALLINNITNTIPSCVPGNDATISINAGGGTLAYSYSIGGPSQAGNIFSNIGAGNYTITVTDAHNCTVTSTQSVITPNGPVINASSNNPVSCFGGNNGSIQVISSGGTGIINYTLQPGNTTNTSGQFVSLTAASYTVTATDILGCAVSASVLVSQPTALNWNAVISNNVSCNGGNNGSVVSSVVGGTGSISYTLQPGAITNTTGSFSSLLANTYTIQASDANGCTTSTIILITQPTPLVWIIVTNTNVQCNGGADATITTTASGGTGIISYTLLPVGASNTNGVFTGLTANNYTIQASDANGCSITTNINISQPFPLLINNVTNTIPSCVPGNDATIIINANGGTLTYSYSIGGPTQPGNIFSNIGAGNYTITVTDAHNCTVTTTQSVITPNGPVITSVMTTNASCLPGNDATLTINATGGTGLYSYAVNASSYQSTNLFTSLGAGTYTVLVKDASACTGSSMVLLLTQNSPTVTAVATTLATCLPGCDATASITASGISSSAFTYSLDAINFQTSAVFNLLCTGQYTVTVKDGNGCIASSLFNILTANGPVISNSNVTDVLCHGGNNGSISVQTSGGSGSINYTLQPSGIQNTNGTFASLVANTYTVIATDINGCTTLSIVSVTEPALLQFSNISASGTLCSGIANGTLNALASGGSGTISYTINPSATFVPPSSFSNLNGNTTYTITAIDANNCSVTTAVFIPQAVAISILSTASVNISCHGANDGSININATGGTGQLNYLLQPGNTTNITGIFNNLSGNLYTVTVSDANNCTISTLLTVTDPPAISLVSMSSSHISCNNLNDGSIAIVCSGGLGNLTYSLQPGSTMNTTGVFSGLSGNTYTIIATDASNCTYSGTTVISNPAPLLFNAVNSTNVLCFGDSNGTVNVSAAGGTGLYTYYINPFPSSNTNGLFNTLPAAVYTVTVNDANNCTTATILSVTQPNAINALLASTQNVTCYAGLNGACTVTANGGILPYVYTLQPGAVSNSNGVFTGLSAGIYSVQVTDSNACSTVVAPIQINQPPQIIWNNISHQDILCFGDVNGVIHAEAIGGAGSFSYILWPTAGTPTTPGTFIDLPANTYTVIATDATGCSISTVVAVTQNPEIVFTRIDFKLPTCHGDDDGSLMADAVGGVAPFIFQLNTSLPATTAYFTNLKSGVYTLTVTDAVGCKKDTVVFLDQPDVVMAAAIDITPVSCKEVNDGEIKVYGTGGTGALTYYLNTAWMINKTGEFIELPQGGYNLTIKDSLGCVFDTVLTVPLPDPMSLIITKKDLGCTGVGKEGWAEANVIGGEPPYSFTWSTNPPQFTSSIHDLYFGIYFVDVADVNGCSTRDTVYIAPGTCCEQVFIPNAFSPNGDGINDVFKVTTTAGIDLLQFAVYDRWGNKVWSTTDFRAAWDGTYKKKEENMDTFFYIFWYTCLTDGQKYMRKGDVMIVR